MNRTFSILLVLGYLAILLAGCNLPASETGTSPASLTLLEPLDGQQFQVGELIRVRSVVSAAEGASSVELLVNGQSVRKDQPALALRNGAILQPWQASQPGQYTLQTRTITQSGASLNSATITIMVGQAVTDPGGTPSTAPASPATAAPSPSPTATETATPPPAPPMATAQQDANCRKGPGQVYDISSYLLNGQSSLITGRNAENTWWVIERMDGNGTCWIWGQAVSVSGDTSGVPIVAAPPTPTPTLTSTPTAVPVPAPKAIAPGTTLSCRSSVFLEWSPVSHPNGVSQYEWQVNGPVETKSGSTSGTRVEFFVSCGAAYSWKVRAVDGLGVPGPYSESLAFSIR